MSGFQELTVAGAKCLFVHNVTKLTLEILNWYIRKTCHTRLMAWRTCVAFLKSPYYNNCRLTIDGLILRLARDISGMSCFPLNPAPRPASWDSNSLMD